MLNWPLCEKFTVLYCYIYSLIHIFNVVFNVIVGTLILLSDVYFLSFNVELNFLELLKRQESLKEIEMWN